MKGLAWSKAGVVVILVIAVAAVMQLKQRPDVNSPGTPVAAATARAPGTPRLLDLGADKCIPCKMMKPVLDGLRKDYAGKLTVDFVDVWNDPSAAEKYGVRSIPTQIFFDGGGKELHRHTGFYSREDILAKFKDLGVSLPGKGGSR